MPRRRPPAFCCLWGALSVYCRPKFCSFFPVVSANLDAFSFWHYFPCPSCASSMYQGGLRHLRTYSIALDYTGTKYTDNTFFSLFGSAPRLRLSFFFFSFFPYPFRAPPPTLLSSGLKVCLGFHRPRRYCILHAPPGFLSDSPLSSTCRALYFPFFTLPFVERCCCVVYLAFSAYEYLQIFLLYNPTRCARFMRLFPCFQVLPLETWEWVVKRRILDQISDFSG